MPEYLINHNRTIAVRINGNVETLCEYDHVPLKDVSFIESRITERKVGEEDIMRRRNQMVPATIEDYEEVMHKAIAAKLTHPSP